MRSEVHSDVIKIFDPGRSERLYVLNAYIGLYILNVRFFSLFWSTLAYNSMAIIHTQKQKKRN